MAGLLDDSNEWELSKENVQPLRQGRKVSSLTAALQPQSIDQQKIKEQKDLFEKELRTYDGDDPLEVWYQYIKWTEQAYPKGGKDGNLRVLLERCISKFKEYAQYQNDPRNIEAWIKFANFCNDPTEIFTFMFDQDLGCEHAMLYEAWAWSLEVVGNHKKADLVFLEGIKRRAEPMDVLLFKHQEFQARVVKEMMKSPDSDGEETEDQRTVLGQLRTGGKHRTVGTTRTGAVKKASRGGLGMSSESRITPQVCQTFEVFSDENAAAVGGPLQTGEWTTVPKRSQDNRENDKKPGPWNKVKLPQKGGVVAASAATSKPSFTVHEDTHEDQPLTSLQKLPELNDRVLSVKKAEKPPLHHMQHQQQSAGQDLNQIPMYCKYKIYTGLNEFSFEEIRAADVYAKKKKREEELKLLEEKRLIAEQRQKLLEEREELANQQEQWRREMNEQQHQMAQQSRQQEQQINSEWKANAEEERAAIEQSFQRLSVDGLKSAGQNSTERTERKGGRVTQQLNFDDMTMPDTVTGDQGQGLGAQFRNESLNSSERTPSLTLPLNTTHSSGSQSRSRIRTPDSDSFYKGRGALTAPSPTVCTLEAINVVRGMFNSSLESDRRLNTSNTMDLKEDLMLGQQLGGEMITNQQAPFTIYSEDHARGPAPVQVYCDDQENKENCMVPRMGSIPPKRKALAGILQPSQTVPVDPTGENDYIMEVKEQQVKNDEEYEPMEGIEQHARDDITIAAVGSCESFSAAAKFASTPYNPSARLPNNSLSTSETHQSNITQSNVTQPQSFDIMMTTPSKKGLSPIFEGLSEGSSEESKSQASSLAGRSGGLSMLHQSHVHTSSVVPTSVEASNKHSIDMTTYVTPKLDEKTEALLNMSVRIDPHNPFDEATVATFLETLPTPLSDYPNYSTVDMMMPKFVPGSFICLGHETYQVLKCIATGGFGKIFFVDKFDMKNMLNCDKDNTKNVLKVQQPACPWEFYICCEIARRLRQLEMPIDITPSIMSIQKGYFYTDGSVLINEYHKYGSLLNVVNQFASKKQNMATFESFALYITIELLRIIENLHKCHIIHGDVKPDNFLVMSVPFCRSGYRREEVFGSCTKCLKLIDFGRSIDMSMYPPNTVFMARSNTSGFQCIEMKTHMPWTYQTDLFGLAGTVHVILFSTYMKIYQENGKWHMTSSLVRKWNVSLWKEFFDTLLNVPSCEELPDLSKLRLAFEDYFISEHVEKYNPIAEKVANMLQLKYDC